MVQGVENEDPIDSVPQWAVLVRNSPEVLMLYLLYVIALCYALSYLPFFKGAAFKLRCYCAGFIHFWACREAKIGSTDWHTPSQLANEKDYDEKEFIFIRHGESEWNEIFNRSKALLLCRLAAGLVREVLYLPFENKSVFLDSALGSTGIAQTAELAHAITSNKKLATALLPAHTRDSVVFTSNLRRCVETTLRGLRPRFEKQGQRAEEKIYVLSCLQEIARNVDTLALTPAGKNPVVKAPCTDLLDPSYNLGTKRWHERAIKRMNIFLKFAFARDEKRIIVVGHSFYFRRFFQLFLDEKATDGEAGLARKKKLSNCGVVRLRVQRGKKESHLVNTYRIVPESIEVLHGRWI
eukprot:Sspe_Gene.9910::Locus_3330_Transcript_1_1_Confidence_1.000_Length_1318::g.9910::m.9910